MLVKEAVTEDEMASIISDAVDIYRHEMIMAYPDRPKRSPYQFAKDYAAMLYSTTGAREMEEDE
jgi:hypothetical protein